MIDRAVQSKTESYEEIQDLVDTLDVSLGSLKVADVQMPDIYEENENVVDTLDVSLRSLKLANDDPEEEYTPFPVLDQVSGSGVALIRLN